MGEGRTQDGRWPGDPESKCSQMLTANPDSDDVGLHCLGREEVFHIAGWREDSTVVLLSGQVSLSSLSYHSHPLLPEYILSLAVTVRMQLLLNSP